MGVRRGGRWIGCALGALVAACALAALGVTGERSAQAAPDETAASRAVDFVPLGTFPRAQASALARFVRARTGLRTQVRGRVPIPRSMLDRPRKQYVAQKLMTLLSRPAASRTVVIGLTAEDMYSSSEPFRFVFSLRSPQGFAVVSRIRMDPRALGLDPDPALRMRRLQKMVLKQVGMLALGHRSSGNPRSVLYDSVLGVDDLDYMTHDFRPAAPSRARKAWLARTDQECERAVRSVSNLFNSDPKTREEFLAFMDQLVEFRVGHQSLLSTVVAAPEDRTGVRALLKRYARSNAADRTAAAKLRARWSQATLQAWVLGNARRGHALTSHALELGSRGCARYFDPLTYG